MDKTYDKGQRLFVETVDGSMEGILHYIDPEHDQMILKQVIFHPDGKEKDGFYRCYRKEILQIRVLEPGSYAGVNKDNEAAGEWNLMRKVNTSMQSSKPLGKVTEADVVMNLRPGHGNKNSAASLREKFNVEDYMKLMKAAQGSVLIDRLGNVFHKAMEDINEEKAVGIHAEGARFGRRSKIALLCVATPVRVFLFDVQTLGEAGFSSGLRALLESSDVEKVIHNCRLLSDCLLRSHNVTLNFVFDTQVADLMVTKHYYADFPRCVRSLSECLTRYLRLPENLLHKPEVRAGFVAMELAKWKKRPLLMELQAAAAKNSVFLLELRKEIYKEMMKPFHRAVDVFCSVVRDSDDPEANEHQANVHMVPFELLSLNDE